MPFTNPLVAGTTLIRTAINSPNYVAGVSGWTINKDGSAEFNNVTVRGALDIRGTDGSRIVIQASSGGVEYFYPATLSGVTVNAPGKIYAADFVWAGGPGHNAALQLASPEIVDATGTGHQANLVLYSEITNGDNYGAPFNTKSQLMDFNGDAYIHGTVQTDVDVYVGNVLYAANRYTGVVSINAGGGVPVSTVITFPTPLAGNNFVCQVTPNTSAPGTAVTGVSYSGLSSTGVTVTMTRIGSVVSTGVSVTVEGY